MRRTAGRRRLKRLTLALAVVAAVVLALAATRTPLLDVDHVRVTGVDGARAEAVLEAAAVASDQPLVSLDAGAVAARVEDLPWVASAQVSRSWPATVRVRVTERVVVAAVQVTEDHVALVDADGYVVAIEQGAVGGPPTAGTTRAKATAAGADGGGDEPARWCSPASRARSPRGAASTATPATRSTVAAAVAERMPDTWRRCRPTSTPSSSAGGVVRFGIDRRSRREDHRGEDRAQRRRHGLHGPARRAGSGQSGLDQEPGVSVGCENYQRLRKSIDLNLR